MAMLSNILSFNNTKNMPGFIKPPIILQSSYFRNAIGAYNKSLVSSRFSELLPTAISSKPGILAQPNPVITLLGSRLSHVYPKLAVASPIAFQPKTKNRFSHVEESYPQVETLVDKVTKFNLQVKNFNHISPIEPVVEAAVETPPIPLNLVDRITELDLQTILLPSSAPNTTSRNNPSEQLSIQSSREEKLIRWILTSHDVYGLAVTVLHNFFDICCQKPEERSFINDSLVPRIRYTGFTFSATAGAVYHVAVGILFTPLVVSTLGQKKEINEIWYGYWAGASISAMGMFAGMFGMVSGNYLIHKTMEKSIPLFKRLLTRCLCHVQIFCAQLNGVDFSRLKQEVKNVKTTAEMVSVTRKLAGIARDLLPTMVL